MTATDKAEMSLQAAITNLGATAFNMEYATFLSALDLEHDDYATDKYNALKAIGRAMSAFSNKTLAELVTAYWAQA